MKRKPMSTAVLLAALCVLASAAAPAAEPAAKPKADPKAKAALEAAGAAQGEAPAAAISWLAYDEGLTRARESGKPLLINFWAEWCHYCKKMQRETYVDSQVAAYVMARFIPVNVNTTTEPRRAAEYFVRGLPTIWFLDSAGEKITNLPGYVDAPMFLKILRYIASGSYQTMEFKAFLDAGAGE